MAGDGIDMMPSGTVTFLFTDIEGSTSLWQKYPAAMPEALARHHALLNQSITANNGYVFQIIGDAFCAAFPTASDGLEAALAAQRSLMSEAWGETGPIRVRMALHTGAAELHAGDYTSGEYLSGITLSRAARLLSAGHGGQVLLSSPTAELVWEQLPPETSLRDMGAHRLKDLVQPQQIYQIIVNDLPTDFPPLKTLDALPNNLPIQLTSFIGREKEIHEIETLFARARLLTLTGPGGAGKTRLSLQLAANIIDTFANGAWFIDLAPLSDASLVPTSIMSSLGLRDDSGRAPLDALTDFLRTKDLLLILDNCEHLVEACAHVAHQLLTHAPKLKILATSREGLGIPGEVTYPVPPLALPDPQHLPPSESLSQYDAVRLFIERATAVQPSFAVNNANAPAVAQICYRLDGIPLAIELAAARIKLLPPEQIAARLDDRFRLLTGGSRTALPRQQTLRAAIDWSYSLLTEQERILFRRLAVFAGGWTFEAAEQICSGDGIDTWQVLDGLAQLVNKSLVMTQALRGEAWYRMLETIREYADEKLCAASEMEVLCLRHLDFYLSFAEQAEPHLKRSEQLEWLERLDADVDNFRAGLDWAYRQDLAVEGLRIATALQQFWVTRRALQEGQAWLDKLLSKFDSASASREYARGLCAAARLAQYDSDSARNQAQQRARTALTLFREQEDYTGIAESLFLLSQFTDSATERTMLLEEMLAVSQAAQDKSNIILALDYLGAEADLGGEIQKAKQLIDHGLSLARELGDRVAIGSILASLAFYQMSRGDLDAAVSAMQERVELEQQLGNQWGMGWAYSQLASITNLHGKYEQTKVYALKSLEIWEELGRKEHGWVEALTFCTWGHMHAQDDPAIVLKFMQQALEVAQASQNKLAITVANFCFGHVEMYYRNFDHAQTLLRESLIWWRDARNHSNCVDTIFELASAAARIGTRDANHAQMIRAGKLYGAAEAWYTKYSLWVPTYLADERDKALPLLREELGERALEMTWRQGSALTMEQAIELALSED